MFEIIEIISYFENKTDGKIVKCYLTTNNNVYTIKLIGEAVRKNQEKKIIIPYQITSTPVAYGKGSLNVGNKIVPLKNEFQVQVEETNIIVKSKNLFFSGYFSIEFDLYFDGILKTEISAVKPNPTGSNLVSSEIEYYKGKEPNNENIALCVNGGGTIAYTMGIGSFSALENILKDINILSSNSGGTWFAGTYQYAQTVFSNEELFGKILQPEDCTLENLRKNNELSRLFLGKRVTLGANPLLYIPELLARNIPREQWWSYFLNRNFLQPYHIESLPVCKNESEALRIKKDNPDYPTPIYNNNGKSWVAIASIFLEPLQREEGVPGIIEMGNEFSGVPLPFIEKDGKVIGGYFQDSFSFGSSPPLTPFDNELKVVGIQNSIQRIFTLSDMMACSSAIYANVFSDINEFNYNSPNVNEISTVLPKVQLWSSKELDRSYLVNIGDGGFYDNTAIIPMLARQYKKILSLCLYKQDIARLCGLDAPSFDAKASAKYTQVFPESAFFEIEKQWTENNKEYGVSFANVEIETLQNSKCNVEKYKVKLFIILFDTSEKFNNLLPTETLDSGDFNNFPVYNLFYQNPGEILALTLQQVNLLVSYTNWAVVQIEPILISWICP